MKKKQKPTDSKRKKSEGKKQIVRRTNILTPIFHNLFFKSNIFKSDIFKSAIMVLLFGLVIFLHLFQLDIDPPYVSWSQDLLTDASQYISFARSKVLWGEWDLFNQYRFLLWKDSALTFLSYLSFKFLGVGRLQANLTAATLNILSLLFLFLAIRRGTNHRVATLTLLFLGINYTFLAYGKETFAEVSAIFFFSLGFYLLVLSSNKRFLLWLAGASHACAILFGKMLATFILPACFIVLILLSIKESKKLILLVLYFVGGFLLVFFPWFFLIYHPASKNISGYLNEMSVGMYGLPEAFNSVSRFFLSLFSFGQVSKVFFDMPALSVETDFFYRMPVIFIVAFIFLLYWFSGFLKRKKISDTLKLSSVPELYSVFWFIFGFLALMPWNYRPLRYQVLLIPALTIMASLGLDRFLRPSENPKEKKLSNPFWIFLILICMLFTSTFLFYHAISFVIKFTKNYASFETLFLISFLLSLFIGLILLIRKRGFSVKIGYDIRMAIVWVLVLLSVIINFLWIFPWLKNPKYSLVKSSQDLGLILNEGAVISGSYASALSPNNKVKLILHMFGTAKADPLLFRRHPITHLALERNGNRQRARQDYPSVMQEAKVIATYYIRDEMPVEIYRVAGATGNLQAENYQLSLFEKAGLLIDNGQPDSGKVLLGKFNQQNPHNLSGHLTLAKLYIKEKDYKKAAESTLRAIKFDERNFALRELLGWIYIQMAIQEKNNAYRTLGIKEWEKALEICPDKEELREILNKMKQL